MLLTGEAEMHDMNLTQPGITYSDFFVYLEVLLDWSLTLKKHCEKVKGKVNTKNNLVANLENSRWGADPKTLRTTGLASYFSANENRCPAWRRSAHAKKVDMALNSSCRCISACLKRMPVEWMYLLTGTALPAVIETTASMAELKIK